MQFSERAIPDEPIIRWHSAEMEKATVCPSAATATCATMCYMAVRERAANEVGVRELRQNLSVYLRHVAAGETLTVTEHGRPVAILAPLPQQGDILDRLIAEGKATPAKGDLLDLGPPPEPDPRYRTGISVSEALEEQRADRL
ncbi:MAG: type II toxin-antitoxin system Phd/YefM family antitoxin [Chloroflexota bacterium]